MCQARLLTAPVPQPLTWPPAVARATLAIQRALERLCLLPRLPVPAAHEACPPRACPAAAREPPASWGRGAASGTDDDRTVAKWQGPASPLGWGEETMATSRDPFLQTSSPNLPTRILFPVMGSSLKGRGVKSCLQALLFCPAARRVFLPLE